MIGDGLPCTLAAVTNLIIGADAAYPGNVLPAGTVIVAGYVGAADLLGQPDTPHLWTVQEWNWYLDPKSERPDLYGGPGLRALPIYTHDFPGDPVADADNAIDAMTDLGWHQDWMRLLAWDSEALIDAPYERALALRLRSAAGWNLLPYGTARTITQVTPPAGSPGLWPALLQPQRPRGLPEGWAGQQWKFTDTWDYDVFTPAVYNQCGLGPRKANP